MIESIIVCKTVEDDNNSKKIVELRKKLPPCPICGRKAYLSHDIADGADFGYSAGCPAFHLKDGIHGNFGGSQLCPTRPPSVMSAPMAVPTPAALVVLVASARCS